MSPIVFAMQDPITMMLQVVLLTSLTMVALESIRAAAAGRRKLTLQPIAGASRSYETTDRLNERFRGTTRGIFHT